MPDDACACGHGPMLHQQSAPYACEADECPCDGYDPPEKAA